MLATVWVTSHLMQSGAVVPPEMIELAKAKDDQAKADQAKSDVAADDQTTIDHAKADQEKADQTMADQDRNDQAKTTHDSPQRKNEQNSPCDAQEEEAGGHAPQPLSSLSQSSTSQVRVLIAFHDFHRNSIFVYRCYEAPL